MDEGCTTDANICCYTDDSGSEILTIACVVLASTLAVTLVGLAWIVSKGLGSEGRGSLRTQCRKEGPSVVFRSSQDTIDISEITAAGTPSNNVRKWESTRSLKSLRSPTASKSIDPLEQPPQERPFPTRPYSSRSCRSIGPARSARSLGPESVNKLRQLLEAERSRRMIAEAAIGRSLVGSNLKGSNSHKCPTAQTVEAHAIEAAAAAARWAHNVTVSAHPSEPELPPLLVSILAHTFMACRGEMDARLTSRVEGMRAFVGGVENVELGAPEGVMARDTQELLYAELWRRFDSIVTLERGDLIALAAHILSRSLTTETQRELGRRLVNRTWSSFEPLIHSYLALFAKSALQRPPVEFEETLGKEEKFDAERHREIATFLEPEGSMCSIVFPATLPSPQGYEHGVERGSDAEKSGVVVWSSNYFRL